MDIILYTGIGLVVGIGITILIFSNRKNKSKKIVEQAKLQAQEIIEKGNESLEIQKKEKILEAKEKLLKMKEEYEREMNQRKQVLNKRENELKQRHSSFQEKLEHTNRKEREMENAKSNMRKQIQFLRKKEDELDQAKKQYASELENISGMNTGEALEKLTQNLKDEAKSRIMLEVKEMEDEARLTAAKEAKKIVIQTIQRTAIEEAIDNMVSVFNIENNEMKGRIIGREGRNIHALEHATGVELIIDDTPETITISCFDPVRREVARLALHKLISDGRIHPAKIEEVVKKTQKQIEGEIAEIGERTVMDLGIHGMHPELIRLVGKMRYRSSYGQNLLHHSKEVSRFCTTMAAELGLNTEDAKRAGLLHDIGKVPDNQPELPHAILGMNLAEKYKENPVVCNAIGAHHEEIEMKYSISHIVQACDAISGIRPGARRDVVESYIKRLNDLEAIAMSFEGVEKTFAIQAGRELRVIVESDVIDDKKAVELSAKISQKIQDELTYPGQIKIAVIRETRAISVAK